MVFVDNMNAKYGRMIMCHMVADSTDELFAMADKIGVKRKWIQKAGKVEEHFDICLAKRAKAVSFGAKEITWREVGLRIIEKRKLYGIVKENTESSGT